LKSDSGIRSPLNNMHLTMERIQSQKGVDAVLIVDRGGAIIKQSKLDDDASLAWGVSISNVVKSLNQLIAEQDTDKNGGTDEITLLRVRTKKKEILVAPEKDYIMMILQTPST